MSPACPRTAPCRPCPIFKPDPFRMPKITLSEAVITRLKPPVLGRADYTDAKVPGLTLRLTATGHASWSVRYRPKNRSSPAHKSAPEKSPRFTRFMSPAPGPAERDALSDNTAPIPSQSSSHAK